jgi:hypothetical protein
VNMGVLVVLNTSIRPGDLQGKCSVSYPRIPCKFVRGGSSVVRLTVVSRKKRLISARRQSVRAVADTIVRDPSKPRFIQHKSEAFWFYRFLSIVYDHIVNPGHWTVDMREEALLPADLNADNLKVTF